METSSRTAPVNCTSCGAPFTPAVQGQSLCDRCQGLVPAEQSTAMRETEVAGYQLVHELGAGRYSTSWLAEDPAGTAVVVKLLRSYAPDSESAQRFIAEAQRLAASRDLDHPNVARLLTGGVHLVSAFFLVYESGGELTLADELRSRGRLSTARSLELCAQLAEGLAAIHRVSVLHLDLKPANVALSRQPDGAEQAVLLDVATAHLLAKSGLLPPVPLPLASAAYLSPEQAAGAEPSTGLVARGAEGDVAHAAARGRAQSAGASPAPSTGTVGPAADLYSLGVLLFQLISGRLPVMGATSDDLLHAHRAHAPLRLRDAGRKVNDELEALLARLLSKDPAQRYSSGEEVAVVMRAMIPIADTAPMEDGDAVDDPVPVVLAPRPEPEIAQAPPPARVPVDHALERAMLGEVPPQPEAAPPGIPAWMPRVWPAWTKGAAVAGAAIVALGAAALLWPRQRPHQADRNRAGVSDGSRAQRGSAAERGAARHAGQGEGGAPSREDGTASRASGASGARANAAEAARAEGAPEAQSPDAPASPRDDPQAPPRPSPWAKAFDRAQKQLWTGQAAGAEATLSTILEQPRASRRDRARAMKMMGDAEVKKGQKAAAIDWYRRSLKLTDSAADRERVARLIQQLAH